MSENYPWPWAKKRRREPWSTKKKWKQILDEPGAKEKLLLNSHGTKDHLYGKFCRRCDKKYYTKSKKSKFCDECKLPQGLGYILKNEVDECQKTTQKTQEAL